MNDLRIWINHTYQEDRAQIVDLARTLVAWKNKIDPRDYSRLIIYDRYCAVNWIQIPPEVKESLDRFESEWLPPVISYESLVLLNDMRNPTLLSDDFQEDEILFYQIHKDIEVKYNIIMWLVVDFLKNDESWIDGLLSQTLIELNEISKLLATLRRGLSTEWFMNMRPYWDLSQHYRKDWEWNAYKWPSGAYSCWLIYMDLLMWIKPLECSSFSMDDSLLPQIQWNWYITIDDVRYLIDRLRETGNFQDRLWKQHQWYQKIIDAIERIRKWHMGLARKYIWEETLKLGWTWGAKNALDFLQDHVSDTIAKKI